MRGYPERKISHVETQVFAGTAGALHDSPYLQRSEIMLSHTLDYIRGTYFGKEVKQQLWKNRVDGSEEPPTRDSTE